MPNIPPNLQLILGVVLVALAGLSSNPELFKKIKDLLTKYLFPKKDPVDIKPSPDLPFRPHPEISVEEAHYQIIRLVSFFSSREDETGIIATSSIGKHLYQRQQEFFLNPPKPPSIKRSRKPKSKTKKITSVTPTLPMA